MSFLKSTVYVIAAQILVLAISFFLRPLTARFLGPTEYGFFALVLSTANALVSLTLFSLNSGVLYYTAKDPTKVKKIVSSAISLIVIISIIAFIPLQIVLLMLAPSLGFQGFLASLALSVILSIFYILQSAQQGLEKFRAFSIYSIASALLAGGAAVLIAFYYTDGILASWGRNIAMLAVAISGLIGLKALGKPDFKELKKIFEYSLPLTIAGLIGAFLVVGDRYLLAAYQGVAEVGFYDIAYSMVAAVLPFSTALITTMMPRVIKQESKLSLYYQKVSQANTILLTSVGLVFFYYSDIFVTILLGKDFQAAVLPFKILSLSLPLMAWYSLIFSSTTAAGRTKVAGVFIALLTVFSLASNFWLVPLYGAEGAAWANVIAYTLICKIGYYYLKTRYGIPIKQIIPQYIVFIAFLLFYMLFFQQGGFISKTIALGVFAAITYFANKQIADEVLMQLRAQIKF